MPEPVTAETFKPEITEAVKAYNKYVVCLEKSTEEARTAIASLVEKAIKAYQNRGPTLRHGIALDPYVTVILSQSDTDRPLCAIYFNLFSPYRKQIAAKASLPKEKPKQ